MDIACRFCLRADGHLIQIFDDTKPIDEIKNKIYECLGILADPSDSLPNYYCTTCENNLELCYEFRCTSRNANDVLVQRLQNQIVQIEDINQHDQQILNESHLMNGNNVYVINLVDEVVEMDQQELQLCQQQQQGQIMEHQRQQIELYDNNDDVISLTDNDEEDEEIVTEQPQDMLTITKVISQQSAETSNDIENLLSPTFIQNYRVEDYIKCNVCRKYYIKMAEHKATHDDNLLACKQCEQTQKRIDNHNKRYHKKEGNPTQKWIQVQEQNAESAQQNNINASQQFSNNAAPRS